jgi:hypothetical protein
MLNVDVATIRVTTIVTHLYSSLFPKWKVFLLTHNLFDGKKTTQVNTFLFYLCSLLEVYYIFIGGLELCDLIGWGYSFVSKKFNKGITFPE